MKIFLDTSSIFKLYHQEEESAELENLFKFNNITQIFLSEISKIEFSSALYKKVRTKDISEKQAQITLSLFEDDFKQFHFISTDSLVIEQARFLLTKYGKLGLRTLDSIQLSTCLLLQRHTDLFLTSDHLLKDFMIKEGLKTN
ncbi:MAG: type II toxin-antitoxin system VapC family toxin [Sphingobacteriales bacterium]|nr:type II toxin-antitoxin system VapC family toxin [Sphingobacteriales bacterium]